MLFTHIEESDQFQIRVELNGETITHARFVQALRPQGRMDFARLLARRDKIRPAGIDHVAIDLDDDAALVHALADGPINLAIVYLWEDGSHLGSWFIEGARAAAPREGLSENDHPARVTLDVASVRFEEA